MLRRTYIRTKRGVSPLIATVLLIAFAVALGAVVMNWGKAQLQTQFEGDDLCELVTIHWSEIDSIPDVCFDGSTLKMTVQNGAEVELAGIQVYVDGTKDIKVIENAIATSVAKAAPKRISVTYEEHLYGTIRKVQAVPKVTTASGTEVCPLDKAVETTSIPTCS